MALQQRVEDARAAAERAKEEERQMLRDTFPDVFAFVEELKRAKMFGGVISLEGRGVSRNNPKLADDRVTCRNCLKQGTLKRTRKEQISTTQTREVTYRIEGCKTLDQGRVLDQKRRCSIHEPKRTNQ